MTSRLLQVFKRFAAGQAIPSRALPRPAIPGAAVVHNGGLNDTEMEDFDQVVALKAWEEAEVQELTRSNDPVHSEYAQRARRDLLRDYYHDLCACLPSFTTASDSHNYDHNAGLPNGVQDYWNDNGFPFRSNLAIPVHGGGYVVRDQ